MLILAELEVNLPSSEGTNTNSALAMKFPSRSREAIKLCRQTSEYKTMLQQVRESQAAENIEWSDDSETSYNPDGVTIDSNSIHINEDNQNPNDRLHGTQRGTNNTSYPNIREYVEDNIINSTVQVCNPIRIALVHYLADVCGSDPVRKSLNGIYEALESVQSSKTHNDEKQTARSKPRSAKAMRKAQRYAHYQRLFKKDKSKLASEIFDGVDNSALKPPMSGAYEHFRKIWTVDTKDAGTLECKASVETDVLLAPITREEIALAIDQTNNDTAVGPDRLPLITIKRIARNELWCAYNIWLGLKRIPDLLKINRIVLLPKGTDDLDNIKNRRPIAIASLLIRLYKKILARRMQSIFRTNSRQTGFKPVNGVGQNVALLHNCR